MALHNVEKQITAITMNNTENTLNYTKHLVLYGYKFHSLASEI